MHYLILIYADPAREPAYGTPEFDAWFAGFTSLNQKLKADGVMRGGDGLHGNETAKSVRQVAGTVETMDGPFAETKEHLGGFYVVDVPDMDTALHYAAMVPSVAFGTVEVRPMRGILSAAL
jgi:hypothetical protein